MTGSPSPEPTPATPAIPPSTQLRAVGQVLVPIADIERACDFYGRVGLMREAPKGTEHG